jgi:arylsulfatase A-like enzyme
MSNKFFRIAGKLGIVFLLSTQFAMVVAVEKQKMNVVFILADDMRSDYLGCMGQNSIVQTPNLDKLAAMGTLFTNAFATTSACTPSRTTIMSGQYERKHGVTFGANSAMNEKAFAKTYPMVLKKSGYYTGYVGKNHSPIGKSEKGFGYESGRMEEMFDYWYGGHRHLTFYPKERHKIFNNAKADNQVDIIREGTGNFFNPNPEFASAKAFLKTCPNDKSFCLIINFNVPHGAGTGTMELRPDDPELYRTTYRDQTEEMPQPETYLAEKDIKKRKIPEEIYNGEYIKQYNYVKTPETLRERQVRTCQTVSGIDNLVGEVIAELKRKDKADNTIIVFTSDHGLQHGEHGLGGKVLLYEESIRIPLIIYDPRISNEKGGMIVDELCLTVDLAPTILDLTGVKAPLGMQGESLNPLLKGENIKWRTDFFCENMFMGQNYPRMEAVRSKDWKYIRYFSKEKDQHHIFSLVAPLLDEEPVYEELYHLSTDPGETNNVIGNPKNKAVLEQLRERCQHLLKEAKDGNKLPKTHLVEWDDIDFKKKVQKTYKQLAN